MRLKDKLLIAISLAIVIASIVFMCILSRGPNKSDVVPTDSVVENESTDPIIQELGEDEEKMLKATINSYCPFEFPINYTTTIIHNENGKRLYQTNRKDIDVFYASYKKEDVVDEHGSWGAIRVSAYNVACYSAIYPVINFSSNASVDVRDTTTEPTTILTTEESFNVSTLDPTKNSSTEALDNIIVSEITPEPTTEEISTTTTEPPTTLPVQRFKHHLVSGKVLFAKYFINELKNEVPPASKEEIEECERLVKDGYNFYAIVVENGKYLDYFVVVDKSVEQDQADYIKRYCESAAETYYNKVGT